MAAGGLLSELVARMRFRGPMTFAEYMGTCLTHPTHGYYMHRDVFGRRGDFVTGPDISQVYGELVGAWCVAMWAQMGEPGAFRVVELGPGRGTLMSDMLRVMNTQKAFARATTVDLVDASPELRAMQAEALATHAGAVGLRWHTSWRDFVDHGLQSSGGPPTLFIGHEFLDALPVHKFRWVPVGPPISPPCRATAPPSAHSPRGEETPSLSLPHPGARSPPHYDWREVLVDITDETSDGRMPSLRLAIAPAPTPALEALRPWLPPPPLPPPPPRGPAEAPAGGAGGSAPWAEGVSGVEGGPQVEAEVCPQAHGVVADMARYVASRRGAALFIDYGYDRTTGPAGGTVRAVARHSFVNLLESPGEVDLSALVDFGAVRRVAAAAQRAGRGHAAAASASAAPAVLVPPLCSQRAFLGRMGLEVRVNRLARAAPSRAEAERVVAAAERLVAVPGMGSEYKVLAFADAASGVPVAFDGSADTPPPPAGGPQQPSPA